MDCKINWTHKAWASYENNIAYLQKEWTEKEISNFVIAADRKIEQLKKHPKIGTSKNKKQPNLRQTIVINKIIVLVYKYMPLKNQIDLLLFWNTRRHPKKLNVK